MVDGSDLREATTLVRDLLESIPAGDWSTVVPDRGGPVGEVVAHVSEVCLWYAIDLTAGGTDLTPVEQRVHPDRDPADLAATLATYGELLARVVDAAGPEERGFHPMGQADPSGFAAMGCDELLVHGRDVAVALGIDLRPPDGLTGRVLGRLFPWVDAGDAPWSALLWANGRIAWQGRSRLEGWRWHCAPLAEWDGTAPAP